MKKISDLWRPVHVLDTAEYNFIDLRQARQRNPRIKDAPSHEPGAPLLAGASPREAPFEYQSFPRQRDCTRGRRGRRAPRLDRRKRPAGGEAKRSQLDRRTFTSSVILRTCITSSSAPTSCFSSSHSIVSWVWPLWVRGVSAQRSWLEQRAYCQRMSRVTQLNAACILGSDSCPSQSSPEENLSVEEDHDWLPGDKWGGLGRRRAKRLQPYEAWPMRVDTVEHASVKE